MDIFLGLRKILTKTKSDSSASEVRRISALAQGQTRVLELLASGAKIGDVCDQLVHVFESYYPDMIATIMLLDEESQFFRQISAPSFSKSFVEGFDGIKLTPEMGSCAAAAFRNERVTVSDVLSSPLCAGFLDVIHENKISSCCSQPVVDSEGRVLGVFSMMLRDQRLPDPEESVFIDSAARLIGLAVERDRFEKAITNSEEQFRSVFETAGTPIVLMDRDLNIIEWNCAAENVFGYSRNEVKGTQQMYGLVPKKFHEVLDQERLGLLAGRPRQTIEIPIVSKTGEELILLWNFSCVRSLNGNKQRFIGVGQDISERKKVEVNLLEAKKSAELANEAKSNFVANMNHELRTPLAAISGLTGILLDNQFVSDKGNEIVGKIENNVDHLLSVVEDLLDLSRVESGHFSIDKGIVILEEFLNEAFSPLANVAKQKGIDFVVNYLPLTPDNIYTDAVRFRQILNNIVGNAVKFTDKGSVVVEIGPGTDSGQERSSLMIRVTDQGCGIDPKRNSDIFRPFVQVDSSSSRRYGGTGLGLSIAERLGASLGGSVYLAESAEGKGSTFVIEIEVGVAERKPIEGEPMLTRKLGEGVKPLEASKLNLSKPGQSLKSFEKIASKGANILLAEDNCDIQMITEHQLGQLGASVTVVSNGELAVKAALENDFDAILMDIQMPVMDGCDAVKALRDNGCSIPIIALTARSLSGEVQSYYDIGFSDCLKKPVSLESLSKALRFQVPFGDAASTETGPGAPVLNPQIESKSKASQ